MPEFFENKEQGKKEEPKTPEQKESEWPSDYYECLQSVFTMDLMKAFGSSIEHFNKFSKKGEKRERDNSFPVVGRQGRIGKSFWF